jgi:hypothetical protein
MGFAIETMEADVFGQIAEQVYFGRVEYDEETQARVRERFDKEIAAGEVIGRSVVFRSVHDGEVGRTIDIQPRRQVTRDPLEYGV